MSAFVFLSRYWESLFVTKGHNADWPISQFFTGNIPLKSGLFNTSHKLCSTAGVSAAVFKMVILAVMALYYRYKSMVVAPSHDNHSNHSRLMQFNAELFIGEFCINLQKYGTVTVSGTSYLMSMLVCKAQKAQVLI